MMGTKARIFTPLTQISLEELVPRDHFYRHLQTSLDLAFVRDLVAPFYALGGRPSIDPVVFFKLQLVMFFDGLRSERQLLALAADRLSVRWYLGYDLHEPLPDHSSLTRHRDRYGVATFRRFFDQILEQCRAAGLVWGQELYFDGTQVEAKADRDAMLPRFFVEALQTHLATLFPEAAPSALTNGPAGEPTAPLLSLPSTVPAGTAAPVADTRAAAADWIARLGRPNRDEKHGRYQRVADLLVSITDPDATLMRKKGGGVHLGYHTHYVVDGGKARIILNTLVTPSEVMDNQPMLDLLWRVCFRWRVRPRQVTGDTKYGTIENIKAIEEVGIRAYIPLPNFEERTPFFGKARFQYEAAEDRYRCPAGAVLVLRKHAYTEQNDIYQAAAAKCNSCLLKAKCTESENGRVIHRYFDEEYLERVRAYYGTAAYKKAIGKRQVWVEPLFGEAKAWHGLKRFRLRGLAKVNVESLLIASGQNLKRLLAKRGWGRRPGPAGAPLQARHAFWCAVTLA
jgi:transposase